MRPAPLVTPDVGDAVVLAEVEDAEEGGAEAALAEPLVLLLALLSAVVMSMGNMMGLPPADMSTLPSAPRTSGFLAKRVRAYLKKHERQGWYSQICGHDLHDVLHDVGVRPLRQLSKVDVLTPHGSREVARGHVVRVRCHRGQARVIRNHRGHHASDGGVGVVRDAGRVDDTKHSLLAAPFMSLSWKRLGTT